MSIYTTNRDLCVRVKFYLDQFGLEAKKFYYHKASMKASDLSCEKGDKTGECLAVAGEIMTIDQVIKVNVVHRFQVVSASKALAFGHKQRQINITVHFQD